MKEKFTNLVKRFPLVQIMVKASSFLQMIPDNITYVCDLGIEPGQLWAKQMLGGFNIDLYRMDDYSGQFEKIARVDSGLCIGMTNTFYRGANPGELYYYQEVQTIGTGVGYYSNSFQQ
ncbi:MAG: hypothetical protein U5Q03_09350 [Bacteroidota bacterium]|nr:hypothetical protein [Bacteroidota bacterium]